MLIKRIYEIDPLACPRCGGPMKVVAFIEPPAGRRGREDSRHCGLWHPAPRDRRLRGLSTFAAMRSTAAKMGRSGPFADPDGDADSQTASDEPRELTYVDIDTFEATF